MYAEAPQQLPFLPGCIPEIGAAATHQVADGWLLPVFPTDIPNGMGKLVQTATILEYDLGGEGDLFKAPEPIIEESILALDPMEAAMSMITGCGDVTTAQSIEAVDLESVHNDPLLSEVFYECKNDLLAKSSIMESLPEISDVQISEEHREENSDIPKSRLAEEGSMQRSVSSGCLSSTAWISGGMMKQNSVDFRGVDLGAAFGMRRACSEGNIQTLGNNCLTIGNMSMIQSSFEQLLTIGDLKNEERRQKLSRYRKKKSKRNFGRKIKYACRKALADSQPRVRGRFAKTEECEGLSR